MHEHMHTQQYLDTVHAVFHTNACFVRSHSHACIILHDVCCTCKHHEWILFTGMYLQKHTHKTHGSLTVMPNSSLLASHSFTFHVNASLLVTFFRSLCFFFENSPPTASGCSTSGIWNAMNAVLYLCKYICSCVLRLTSSSRVPSLFHERLTEYTSRKPAPPCLVK